MENNPENPLEQLVSGKEEIIDESGPQYQELIRLREAKEIDPIDYEVNELGYLQAMDIPLCRSDVGNKAIVIRPSEYNKLGYLDIVTNEGEIITIDFEDVDQTQPFILFPNDLGELPKSAA